MTTVPITPVPSAPVAPVPPAPPKIRPKLGMNALSVTLMSIVVGLVLLVALAFLVAKAGLATIPFFSGFYHGPKPVRIVQTRPLTWDVFETQLAQRITQQRNNPEKYYSIKISEEELSGLLMVAADQSLRNHVWKVVSAQLAVTPDDLEVFLKLTWHTYGKLDLLIRFRPVIDEDGDIRFQVTGTQVGDFILPASWGTAIGSYLFSRDLGSWEMKVSEQKSVQSLSLLDKSINVILLK